MDTSKTYIKMCDCEEIQGLWKPVGGDWYVHDYRGTTKTSRKFEEQIWGDDDKTWEKVEILCYRPTESKDVAVSTDGERSLCIAVADLVRKHSIWLPRQDQLQEMVPTQLGSTKPNYKMISELNAFYDYWDTKGIPNNLTTWEQLWLAFCMSENHNKVWTGEKWEKV